MQAQEKRAVASNLFNTPIHQWMFECSIPKFTRTNAGQRGFPLSFKPLCWVSPSPIHRRQATIDKAMNWHTVMLGRICLMCSAQLWTITWSPVAPRCRAMHVSTCRVWALQALSKARFFRPKARFNKQSSRKFVNMSTFQRRYHAVFISWISGHCYWPHLKLSVWENLGCGSRWWILQPLSPATSELPQNYSRVGSKKHTQNITLKKVAFLIKHLITNSAAFVIQDTGLPVPAPKFGHDSVGRLLSTAQWDHESS